MSEIVYRNRLPTERDIRLRRTKTVLIVEEKVLFFSVNKKRKRTIDVVTTSRSYLLNIEKCLLTFFSNVRLLGFSLK